MHVAVGVGSLESSKQFYTRLFDSAPSMESDDQVDWVLDSPAVHFSIFHNPDKPLGVEHIGVDFPHDQLEPARARMGTREPALSDPDGLRVEIYSKE
jgi:catechol 2,3-dioxygenase-like lactoylglutathione lyase family enzyme